MSLRSDEGLWQGPEEAGRPSPETAQELVRCIDRALDEAHVLAEDSVHRYRIEGELGRGGMGVVFQAFDPRLRRTIALKVARATQGPEARRLRRFLREARITGQLQHPGIVPVHELGVGPSGEHYFTMPLVRGERLDRVFQYSIEGRAGWSLPRAIGILLRVSEALSYAHGRGVVHRDLKPENVMVGSFGETYVMDWGLARVAEEGDEFDEWCRMEAPDLGASAALRTRAGNAVGSPSYVAPEQATGKQGEVGPRSDVYSLGAMLYALLAGRAPYSGEAGANASSFEHVLAGPPAPIQALARDQPAELVSICERAMAREPAVRYASMTALADDLRAFLDGRVVRAHRVGALAELHKWTRRNRAVASWMLATLVVAFLAAGALIWTQSRARREQYLSADALRLPYLCDQAEDLWPAVPERVQDMEDWLVRARECVGRLEIHLERKRSLERTIAGRAPDPEERRALRTRTELVEQLATFGARIAEIEERLAFARAVEWRSLLEPSVARRWRDAVDAVADPRRCPLYNGLVLFPQLGFVPVGPDPDSGLWEFAQLASGLVPERGEDGRLRMGPESGLVFVLLPACEFLMGSQTDRRRPLFDPQSLDWEQPPNVVRLDAFLLAKYELTQAQWRRLTGEEPSQYSAGQLRDGERADLHPVEHVSWTEAFRVLARVELSLPTEAQWEYAARAGTQAVFVDGDYYACLAQLPTANLYDMQGWIGFGEQRTIEWEIAGWLDDGHAVHAPVGSFAPNPFGLHDMLGNVWEWCEDWLTPYATPARVGDGLRSEHAPGRQRVLRGGSFRNSYSALRCSVRENMAPDVRMAYLGVRPARRLAGAPTRASATPPTHGER
jgi:formylglycine-generating enzyme required for sulfatase activity